MKDPAVYGMIMFYSMSLYPKFEEIGEVETMRLADEASKISMIEPLLDGSKNEYLLPHIGKVSTGKAAAVMSAALVWHQRCAGITELPASDLLSAANDGYNFWKLTQSSDSSHKPSPGSPAPDHKSSSAGA